MRHLPLLLLLACGQPDQAQLVLLANDGEVCDCADLGAVAVGPNGEALSCAPRDFVRIEPDGSYVTDGPTESCVWRDR